MRTVQIRRAFAQTVRELRLKAGLSQERLALNLGIDRGNLASLERGVHTPRLYTIARLLPGLHITFVEFVQEFERILNQTEKRQPCRLLEHDFEVVETYDRYTRKLHCRRCGQYFAMSDRYQALLPWSDEFERLARSSGMHYG
jgi:transcriptional regulator with XRE-family HTH domain